MSEQSNERAESVPADVVPVVDEAQVREGADDVETKAETVPISNSQKVIEWIGLYYALCTGVTPPWLTVDAGGFKEVSFNLGNVLITGVGAIVGYLWGRAGVAVGRVAIKAATGV